MKHLYTLLFLLVSNILFSQEFNLFELVAENKKSNTNLLNLAETIYLSSDLKISNYTILHFTNNKIQDTILSSGKKKKVTYRNFKVNCEFSLNTKLNSLYESNQMRSSGIYKNHLIINSETLSKIDDNDRFIIHEIDTDSELAIQREINSIKSSSKKTNVNVYVFIDKFNMSKPEFKFDKDTITSSGLVELKYTTSTKSKKIEWSSNVKFKNDDFNSPIINVTANDKVLAYYIDENGCKSNQDEVLIQYKENCNCEINSGKPELMYFKSKNIIEALPEDDAEWEYKFIPETNGDLNYEIPVKDVCGERFLLEVRYSSGKVLYTRNYERSEIDERSYNNLVIENKNILVFNVELEDYRNQITLADAYFVISIIPIVGDEECTRRKVNSSKVRFSKCR